LPPRLDQESSSACSPASSGPLCDPSETPQRQPPQPLDGYRSINAVAEAFWGRLQVELLNRQRWSTRLELANAIFESIEGFHNRRRRHSSIGSMSPIVFENTTQQAGFVASATCP
jgi:hypothetical protein